MSGNDDFYYGADKKPLVTRSPRPRFQYGGGGSGVARNCAAALMTSVARTAVYTFIRVNSRLVRVRPRVRVRSRPSSIIISCDDDDARPGMGTNTRRTGVTGVLLAGDHQKTAERTAGNRSHPQ